MDTDVFILNNSSPKIDKKAHLQRWSKECFFDKLSSAGFTSYKDEGLSWYKVVNGELLHSVYLFNQSPYLPMMPVLGYGCHPLFISAPIPQKVTIRGWVDVPVMRRLYFDCPKVQFDENTFVLCTESPERGAEILDRDLFPLFSKVQTIEDAYLLFREHTKGLARIYRETWPDGNYSGSVATLDEMDMAIYLNDTEMLQIYANDIENWYKLRPSERKRIDGMCNAIFCNQRDDYLMCLDDRKNKFLKTLRQKLKLRE